MIRWTWRNKLAVLLVLLSAALFTTHYLIFRDASTLAFYTFMDLAFMPLELLIVTIIIHELLENRARFERVSKLHMVIGAFFSETGNELLRMLIRYDETPGDVCTLAPQSGWQAPDFVRALGALESAQFAVRLAPEDLRSLHAYLHGHRDFLLRLLENPNLLEHESFTDLLWAVFHLAEELDSRTGLEDLPASDLAHLHGDAERAYRSLLREWLGHARHLSDAYPYLYSLLVRTNPLLELPCATVTA